MSVIPLSEIKLAIRIDDSDGDAALQRHLDASESEICRFLNRTELPTLPQDFPPLVDVDGTPLDEVEAHNDNIAPEIFSAVCLLVQAKCNTEKAEEIDRIRSVVERMVYPYRVRLGA